MLDRAHKLSLYIYQEVKYKHLHSTFFGDRQSRLLVIAVYHPISRHIHLTDTKLLSHYLISVASYTSQLYSLHQSTLLQPVLYGLVLLHEPVLYQPVLHQPDIRLRLNRDKSL